MKAYLIKIADDGPQPVDLAAMLSARGLKAEVIELPSAGGAELRDHTRRYGEALNKRIEEWSKGFAELHKLMLPLLKDDGEKSDSRDDRADRTDARDDGEKVEKKAVGVHKREDDNRTGVTDPVVFVNREQLLLSMRHARGQWVKTDHVPSWLAEALLADGLIESAPHPGGVRWSGYRLTTRGMLHSANADPTGTIGPPGS